MSKMKDVDPVLKWFWKKCRAKLARPENQRKSSWRDMTFGELALRLDGECGELEIELNKGLNKAQIISECCDVANFAMMIADRARKEKP